jgi:hypothetical protein
MIDREFQARIQEIVDEQGWDDNTMLDLALNFIKAPPSCIGPGPLEGDDAFISYLREVQQEENYDKPFDPFADDEDPEPQPA